MAALTALANDRLLQIAFFNSCFGPRWAESIAYMGPLTVSPYGDALTLDRTSRCPTRSR